MGIRNKSAACLEWIRNYTVHHTKTWLPYGAILLFLAGVWFLWDGPTDRQETIREKEIATRSLSPAFSSSDQTSSAIEKTTAGRPVYSLAGTLRRKPLGDLFSGATETGTKAAAPEQKETAPGVKQQGKDGRTDPARQAKTEPLPEVCGFIRQGSLGLVILKSSATTKACGPGDTIGGYYVTYVRYDAVGLTRQGETYEIYL